MNINELFERREDAELRRTVYIKAPNKIGSIQNIEHYERAALDGIRDAENTIKILQEYRQALFNRYQEIYTTNYKLILKIRRSVHYYNNLKKYTVSIVKRFDGNGVDDEEILREIYDGKERHKAIKRFEALKKEYPNIEFEIDITKKSWEK